MFLSNRTNLFICLINSTLNQTISVCYQINIKSTYIFKNHFHQQNSSSKSVNFKLKLFHVGWVFIDWFELLKCKAKPKEQNEISKELSIPNEVQNNNSNAIQNEDSKVQEEIKIDLHVSSSLIILKLLQNVWKYV